MCDYLSANAANQWYYDLQEAIASLQHFPYRCPVAPEADIIGREIRQLWVGKARTYRILFVVECDADRRRPRHRSLKKGAIAISCNNCRESDRISQE